MFFFQWLFSIICVSFFSSTVGLWLNWLFSSLLRSDKEENLTKISSNASLVTSLFYLLVTVLCFSLTKQNCKHVKMNVLENEMCSIIVLMISAVGWTLHGEKWEEVACSPPLNVAHCFFIAALLLSPIGFCYPTDPAASLSEDGHRNLFWPRRHVQQCAANSGAKICMYLELLSSALVSLSCLRHLNIES